MHANSYLACANAAVLSERDDAYLQTLHDAGVRGARFTRGGLGIRLTAKEQANAFAKVKAFGWYVKIQPEPEGIVEQLAAFESLDVPVLIDHMGRADPTRGDDDPSLVRILELLARGNWWVMLSLSEKLSRSGRPWDDVVPLAQRIVASAPDRCVWGSDWPHPVSVKQPPNEGELLELLYRFAPDEGTRRRLLVDNPARLFGFDAGRRHTDPIPAMKLLSYAHEGVARWGAVSQDGVVDLGSRLTDIASIRELFAGGDRAMDRARDVVVGASADAALTDIVYRLPVPEPRKIFCIGVNYAHRNAEYKDGSDLPNYPSIFMRVPDSFAAHGQPLRRPPESVQLDYEGEIGIVVGRAGRRIPRESASSYIGGLTRINEGTIRDWVHHAKFNVTQGKNFHASGSIGPWITTADEYAEGYGNLRVQTRVDGESRQDDTTDHLMFDFAYLMSYLSTFTTLEPGDVIATGTPVGAGIRFGPPRFLQPGNTVEVEVTGVGTMLNPVRDEEVAV